MRRRLSQIAPQQGRKCLMSWQQRGLAYYKTLANKKARRAAAKFVTEAASPAERSSAGGTTRHSPDAVAARLPIDN